QLEQLDRRSGETRQSMLSNLPHSSRASQLLERARQSQYAVRALHRFCLDQRAPQLTEQERRSLRQGMEGVRNATALDTARAPDELGHVILAQSTKRDSLDTVDPRQRGQSFGQLSPHVLAAVTISGEQEDADIGTPPRQIAEQQQRRPVRPVNVLDDHQQRTLATDVSEQRAYGGVQLVSCNLRVRRSIVWRRPELGQKTS